MSGLFGGSKSQSKSGYSALPKNLKESFGPLGVAIGQYTDPNREGVTEMFTPMGMTGDESAAFDMMRGGFTPTAQSLQSDISMQMNPYNQFVIDEINRQSGGQYSLLNQALSGVGQLGSNRQLLGANDIDLSRTNQIGGFLQGQYNTALNNAMTVMPGLRQQDASNLMGIGGFQRGLDTQTRQAPISALQAGTGMLGPFMSGGTSTQKQSGGITDLLMGAGGLAMGLGSMGFSDARLKEDIHHLGKENGHNVYRFRYLNGEKEYIGVMAQEVANIDPEAVGVDEQGFMHVDYDKIGVKFREYVH